MPRYRFEFVDEPETEPVYVDLADDDSARQEACRALAEGTLDQVIERGRTTDPATKVYEAAGYLIATVRTSDTIGDEPGVMRPG